MIRPVIVPLESLEAEEDNEPPSLEKRHDLFAYPCFSMDSPSFGLTSKSKFIRQNSSCPITGLSINTQQGRCIHTILQGSTGKVLTFFPWSSFYGPPRC